MATRILVINDPKEILEMFQLLLEGEGYEVVLSSYPILKASEIEEIRPELIVLDLIFGQEKLGWQMLQMLKMQRPTQTIPVILCIAALQAVREQEGYLIAQGVEIIYKPFDINTFLTLVHNTLQSHKKDLKSVSEQNE